MSCYEHGVRVTWDNGASSILTDPVDIRAVRKMTVPKVEDVMRRVTEWSALRCPSCDSINARVENHWEEPGIVCSSCGYGT